MLWRELLSERELGVSRAQIWKHVGAAARTRLRDRGHAQASGYRADPLKAPTGSTRRSSRPASSTRCARAESSIHLRFEVDSTNRVAHGARRQAGARARHDRRSPRAQSAGRGRLGRPFFSPPHTRISTASVVLRPPLDYLRLAPTLILATSAVAVAETAVAEAVGDPESRVEIKWPNDVLAGRARKTCGHPDGDSSAEATRVGLRRARARRQPQRPSGRLFPDDFRASRDESALVLPPVDR